MGPIEGAGVNGWNDGAVGANDGGGAVNGWFVVVGGANVGGAVDGIAPGACQPSVPGQGTPPGQGCWYWYVGVCADAGGVDTENRQTASAVRAWRRITEGLRR